LKLKFLLFGETHFITYATHLTVYKLALNYDENTKNGSKGESLKYTLFHICMRQLFNTIEALIRKLYV